MSLATPDEILEFWIGKAATSAEALGDKMSLWFKKSDETDELLRTKFGATVEALADGLAEDWSAQGARPRLAAIIALDQFSRNIYRETPESFANDPLAAKLALRALGAGDHERFSVAEQAFLYLPLEHAENAALQVRSVELFDAMATSAPSEFQGACDEWLDYARQHKDVIDRFGRFPHRNEILGRESTAEELEYLSKPGAGF